MRRGPRREWAKFSGVMSETEKATEQKTTGQSGTFRAGVAERSNSVLHEEGAKLERRTGVRLLEIAHREPAAADPFAEGGMAHPEQRGGPRDVASLAQRDDPRRTLLDLRQ